MSLGLWDIELHNRLGSATQVNNSDIGVNGTITDTVTYSPAKFDNGALSDAVTGFITFNPTITNTNRFIMECWIKATAARASYGFENVINVWDSSPIAVVKLVLRTTGTPGILVQGFEGSTLFDFTDTHSWVANELMHFLVVVDNTASFDGSKTVALYRNGIQTASSTAAFTFTGPWEEITACGRNGGLELAGLSIVDGLKLYNEGAIPHINDILQNRYNEFFGHARMIGG